MTSPAPTTAVSMKRFNVVLSEDESSWLDKFVEEVGRNGGSVSRSEIVRAGIECMREMERLAQESSKCPRLASAKSGADLSLLMTLVARLAAADAP